jgi:hypothetical protein
VEEAAVLLAVYRMSLLLTSLSAVVIVGKCTINTRDSSSV